MRHAPVELTLIDRRNFHLFQPLLYQVATGSLSPGEISAPLRSILRNQKNTRVLLGEAGDIDPKLRRVVLKDGSSYDYDSLIVATGSKTSYYGNDQWRTWAPSLKTVEEATAIRHKILYAFEAAECERAPEARHAWLTFVIVGAGATGVELAGALGEISRETLRHDFRSIHPPDSRILLLDGSPRPLMQYPENLSAHAEKSLIDLGVRFIGKVKVVAVDSGSVTYEEESGARKTIATKTVLWAGGVTVTQFGRTLAERTGAKTDRHGHIEVLPDLTVPGYPEIYVVGDLAAARNPDGSHLPGVAPAAMQSGSYVAKTILARLNGATTVKPFHYLDKGELAVIGRGRAVARIFGLQLSGLPAWLVWLFVHLMYLVQFRSRFLVFAQWGMEYISFNRGARLITGKLPGE